MPHPLFPQGTKRGLSGTQSCCGCCGEDAASDQKVSRLMGCTLVLQQKATAPHAKNRDFC